MPFFCTKYRISRFSLSTGIPVVRKVRENFPNDDDDDDDDRTALRRASCAEQTTELGPLQARN